MMKKLFNHKNKSLEKSYITEYQIRKTFNSLFHHSISLLQDN